MTSNPKRTFTLDDNTYASNPGGLRVDYLYWMCSFPAQPLQLISSLIILTIFTLLINWVFGLALLSILSEGKKLHLLSSALPGFFILNIFLFVSIFLLLKKIIKLAIHVRERFLHGCVNPGIVVSIKPPLVAVFTDLTTSRTPRHVIKILPQPLRSIRSGILSVGTKLATIALYEGNVQKGHWNDFHPTVINCVTGNQADIERVFRSIPDWEWEQLNIGLGYLRATKPGLYTIPFIRCAFCHETVFLPLYPKHKEEHTKPLADGQMTDHITLSPEQRYQERLDQVPEVYIHPLCGGSTGMPEEIIRSYLVNPFLYNEYTFCCGCNDYVLQQELYWHETGQCLADYFKELQENYIRRYGNSPPSPFV